MLKLFVTYFLVLHERKMFKFKSLYIPIYIKYWCRWGWTWWRWQTPACQEKESGKGYVHVFLLLKSWCLIIFWIFISKEPAGRLHIKTTADLFLQKYDKRAAMMEKELEIRKMELNFQRQNGNLKKKRGNSRWNYMQRRGELSLNWLKKYAASNN